MSSKVELRKFLEAHPAEGVWTHTSLAGGKYFIPEDDKDRFYELYVESILDGDHQYLTEKSTEIGPLRIDFDFIYDTEVKKHLHTQEQTINFCKAYMNEIKQLLVVPESVDIYIMEKRKPTFDEKKNRYKSGIHIVIPQLCSHKFVEQRVRRALVGRMDEFFGGLPLKETWDKVYDESVVNRSVPWTLYGSRKADPGCLTYEIAYILDYKNENDVQIKSAPELNVGLMKTLSLCRDEKDETPMTEDGKQLYDDLRKKVEVRGGGQQKARGRPLQRNQNPGSRTSSPSGRVLLQPLDADRKQYYRDHVMNLGISEDSLRDNPTNSEPRYVKYNEWIQVAICLHNIHPDLLDVFLDFSAQDEKKYNEGDCINYWNRLTFRNDGDRLGEGTLRYWSRCDNKEGYDEIEKTNVDRLIMTACSCTEHDVAAVIYAKFRDAYKCSDFRNNVWYRWTGHIWRETDSGIDLLMKLSKQVAAIFFDKATSIMNETNNRGLLECENKVEKKDCEICEYCKLTKQRKELEAVFKRLKTTAFKSNVMKECRELFFDEEFGKKLDANKDLIAFNNGVFDISRMEIRDGKPEDCISFSTGIDYDEDREYYQYDTWPQIEKFIREVLPDKEVREYFIKHLATNLIGGNTAQKFHILTGSGSNGKSMLMNLTSAALGDYACTVPISLFTQARNKSSAAAPEVIRLKGRRFVTMQEPDESIALNTGLMKEITSGEKMYARDLFKSGTEFEVQAKFHLACNEKPKINTTDGGTWRRLVVIAFISKFVVNPSGPNEFLMDESLQFAVKSTEWAKPFLSYLVHVLKEGKGLHKLSCPSKVLEYTSEYRNETDGIAKFISDCVIPLKEGDEIHAVDKPMLKRKFKLWADDNAQRNLSPTELEKRIEAQFGKYQRGGWTNFKLE